MNAGAPPRTILVHLADQRRDRTDSHGIINFSLGLVRALPPALSDRERLVVLANDALASELDPQVLRDQDELRLVPAPRSTVDRLRLDHRAVHRTAGAVGAGVVVYPKGFLPLGSPSGVVQAVCLHDDIPERLWHDRSLPAARRARSAYFAALTRRTLRKAGVRLFVSETTRAALTALVPGDRAGDTVISEGLSMPRHPLVPRAQRRRRAFVFGSALPHKRVAAGLALIGGDAALREAIDEVLVVGGPPPAGRCGPLAVRHRPGPVDSAELATLLAESRVLVYPSEHEGFGLPPLEALALGTPAVFRRSPVADELLAEVPGGYRDETPVSFADAAATALALDDGQLAAWSSQVRDRFPWSAVAERVAGAIRAATGWT